MFAVNGFGSLFAECERQRLSEPHVLFFQVVDALGRGLETPEQGGVGGALPVRHRRVLSREVSTCAEALDLAA